MRIMRQTTRRCEFVVVRKIEVLDGMRRRVVSRRIKKRQNIIDNTRGQLVVSSVENLKALAILDDQVRQDVVIGDEALEHVRLVGKIGKLVLVSPNFDISQIGGDKRKRALLVGLPEPRFAKGIKVCKDILELLSHVGIVAKTPMPDFGTD